MAVQNSLNIIKKFPYRVNMDFEDLLMEVYVQY